MGTCAGAHKDKRERCQACEEQSFAMCLWYNEGPDTRPERGLQTDDDKPHDSARCEACRQGDCKVARSSLLPATRLSSRSFPEPQARAPVQAASSGVTSTARSAPEPQARAPVQAATSGVTSKARAPVQAATSGVTSIRGSACSSIELHASAPVQVGNNGVRSLCAVLARCTNAVFGI